MTPRHRPFSPIPFAGYEHFLMRVLFALVVWHVLQGAVYEVAQPKPVGLARLIDFTFLGKPAVYFWCKVGAAVCLAVYIWGRNLALVLPPLCVLVLGYGALKNSQGASTHHMQVVGIVLLVQTVWYVWRAVSGRLRIDPSSANSRQEAHRAAPWISMQAIAATYVVTAITKLINSGGNWIRDAKFFPLQLEKVQQSDYYNRLEHASRDGQWFGGINDALTRVFVESPNLCRAFLASGLALELFAFLALWGRKSAAAYGVALVVFHLTISRIMELDFELNMFVLAIFFVNLPYWVRRPFGGA